MQNNYRDSNTNQFETFKKFIVMLLKPVKIIQNYICHNEKVYCNCIYNVKYPILITYTAYHKKGELKKKKLKYPPSVLN